MAIQVEKEWVNGPQPYPEVVDIVLMRSYEVLDENGQPQTIIEPGREHQVRRTGSGTEQDPYVWALSFDSLPASDVYGRAYSYYATEGRLEAGQVVEAPPAGYQIDQTLTHHGFNDVANRFESTITNRYVPPTGEISATKEWHVDADSAALYPEAYRAVRQDIWMQLYRTTDVSETPVLVADSRQLLAADAALLTITWTNMPLKNDDGVDYIYSMKEVGPDGEENWAPINFNNVPDVEDKLKIHNHFLQHDERSGKLIITKHLLDANGKKYGEDGYADPVDGREFIIYVNGPYGYRQAVTLKAGESKELTNLAYGLYSLQEDDVDGTLYENPVYAPVSATLNADSTTALLEVTNQEKAIGQLTLRKLVEDSWGQIIHNKLFPDDPNASEVDERAFTFLVEGPLYYDGEVIAEGATDGRRTLVTVYSNRDNDPAATLAGLSLGKYRISEVDGIVIGDKTVSDLYAMPSPVEVILDVRHNSHDITLTNRELDVGEVVVHKMLLDANGHAVSDGRRFHIMLDGELLAESKYDYVESGTSVTFAGLPFGSYIVLELEDSEAYTISHSLNADGSDGGDYAAITLTLEDGLYTKHRQDVYITNQELANGELNLRKLITNTTGGTGASAPDQAAFDVRVAGPGGFERVIQLPANGEWVSLDNLVHGRYTVEELYGDGYNLDDYVVTNPQTVMLGYDPNAGGVGIGGINLYADLTISNVEKRLAKLRNR